MGGPEISPDGEDLVVPEHGGEPAEGYSSKNRRNSEAELSRRGSETHSESGGGPVGSNSLRNRRNSEAGVSRGKSEIFSKSRRGSELSTCQGGPDACSARGRRGSDMALYNRNQSLLRSLVTLVCVCLCVCMCVCADAFV
jgi:hypothetical protein